MNEKDEIIKLYRDTRVTSTFDEERWAFEYQRYKHRLEASVLSKVLKNKGKIRVLDVACGTGRMVPVVFNSNKEVGYTGLDTSKEMTAHLKKKANGMGIGKSVKVVIGDATKMPFKDNEFDVVFSYHLLWHLPKEEQDKIIKEMVRVARPGGMIVFDILNKNFLYEKIKDLFNMKKLQGIHKMTIGEARIDVGNRNVKVDKLFDAHIENSFLYGIINLLNKCSRILPSSLFHMLFLTTKK